MALKTETWTWEKLGRILVPEHQIEWLATCAGPGFAMETTTEPFLRVYVTGRDSSNRSRIGMIELDVDNLKVRRIAQQPVLSLGRRGTFDENGTGYPFIVQSEGRFWMYYVGWVPAVLVPFQNDIGLAVSDDGLHFERVSEAPILSRTNSDCLSLGSACVIKESGLWRMWYTSFTAWGTKHNDPKHFYHIKYAESENGIDWRREDKVAVTYSGGSEYVLGKPSVIKLGDKYRMWFCHRGAGYRIGYAESPDGLTWTRRDDLAGINCSDTGWDSEAICYPHCFWWHNELYMLYNGNDYGRTGLGIARLKRT
jgi:predicted GH43/DUF377 family glycosyl hydrolase